MSSLARLGEEGVFDLTEGLIRRGYTDAQIAQILGGNAVRALASIWPA